MKQNLKLIKTIHYFCGYDNPEEKNKEYLELEKEIKEKGKQIHCDCWEGDMLVAKYEMNGKIYKISDDMEYGVPYSIEIFEKEN